MALSDNRTHRTLTLCALYFAQGIPWGFMLITLPSYLAYNFKDIIGDDEIGTLKAIILVPWSFKLIWAPIMDSFTIRSMGRRRPWIIGSELLMALTLLGMIGLGDLSQQVQTLVWMYFIHNCFASLQDVCTDALAVDILPPNEQGKMNGLMWGSKLVGKAGGAWVLSHVMSWAGIEACVAIQVALLLLIMAVPLLILERPGEKYLPWSASKGIADPNITSGNVRNPLATLYETFQALSLPTLLLFVFFTLTKLIGSGVNEVAANTLYTQQLGWTDVEFSTASGLYLLVPLLLVTFLGGAVADRFGRRLVLCVGFGGLALSALVFASCSHLWEERWFTLSYLLYFEIFNAIGSVGFLSMAMRISWSQSAATVFTLYMTLSNVSHIIGNWLAGPIRSYCTRIAESNDLENRAADLYSYELTFWFVGLVTLPTLLLLLRVRTDEVDAAKERERNSEQS